MSRGNKLIIFKEQYAVIKKQCVKREPMTIDEFNNLRRNQNDFI